MRASRPLGIAVFVVVVLMWSPLSSETNLGMGGQPFLEDLAVAARGLAEAAGRDAGGAVEGPHEVREIAEAGLEGHVGDRAVLVGQQPGRAAQAGAHEVLVGRD